MRRSAPAWPRRARVRRRPSSRAATTSWWRTPRRSGSRCDVSSTDYPERATQPEIGGRRMRLEDKVSIITGAGQGIGEAYARRFAQEGALGVVADVNGEKGGAVARAIGGSAVFERRAVWREAG